MKRILSALCMALLVACSGGGVVTPPTPTPSPQPTLHPVCNSAAFVRPSGPHSPHIMRTMGASIAASGAHLSYGGGAILPLPKVYVVLWGYGASDPVAQRLTDLYSNVGGSGWFETVTQYCESPGTYIGNPTGLLQGVWSDMSAVPKSPTQNQLAAEAVKAASHFGATDFADDTVVVATESGHSMNGFKTQWCGWHDYTGSMSYEYIPYIPDAGQNCGADSVNGSGGTLDGVSIIGGHELAESATDPFPSTGWTDTANGEEVGDLCAWKDLQDVNLNGVSLPMQPLWSNESGGCAQ